MGNSEDKPRGLFQPAQQSSYTNLKKEVEGACKCSLKVRIMGWVISAILGWLIEFIGMILLIRDGDLKGFGVCFAISQIINLGGTCFLAGPVKQVKAMVKKARLIFTICYLMSTVLVLVLALTLDKHLSWLVLVAVAVQMVSYFLYVLSFIPFGLKILRKICISLVD